MGSVLSWAANSVLFVVGCFLAADTANQVIEATLLSTAPEVTAPAPTPEATRQRDWAQRQVILSRNLFNSSTLNPPPPPEEEIEDIEKSRLPVTLLGTFAASDPALSRATLQDKEKRETLVVAVGDQIKNQALVVRIERRRVVLSENGVPRELTLDEEDRPGLSRPVRTARAARPARTPPPSRRTRPTVSRDEVEDAIRNPAALLSQARVLPKFEDGEMVGLQVSGIKSGSLFEEIGLEEGDVITELNGIAINSPDESMKILQELTEAEEFNVVVVGADGEEKVRNVGRE